VKFPAASGLDEALVTKSARSEARPMVGGTAVMVGSAQIRNRFGELVAAGAKPMDEGRGTQHFGAIKRLR